MQEVIVPLLSKAEENCLTIAGLVKRLHYDFLELGGLLLENQASAFWSASGSESFKDFVQQLGIGYPFATRLMGLAQLVIDTVMSKEELIEIGVAKACLLLPHIKKGELPEEIKLLARDCTFQDLRLALKHDIIEGREQGDEIYCPRCGVRLYGLQFASPLHRVSLNE